ncbi:hypothetical protein PV336_43715, partial [Streptomyces sp. MI02-2A]|uniref:hypothetical protein n=1 Tax=Streptomyces sp. MI02-2A TaxID=3028688 RepID=UPI0029BBAB6F
APQQSRPESRTLNATPSPQDTHHHNRPDQALLGLRRLAELGGRRAGGLRAVLLENSLTLQPSWVQRTVTVIVNQLVLRGISWASLSVRPKRPVHHTSTVASSGR